MGNAASEMQHLANQLQGVGPDEKKFVQAIYDNNVAEAQSVLIANPNVIYARTKDWYNGWHLAAKSGSLEMIEMLKSYGKGTRKAIPGETAPYNVKSKKGLTPLMVACTEGHLEAAKLLLLCGAEVLSMDMYGNTCVHYVAYNGQTELLQHLLWLPQADGGGSKIKRYSDLRNESGLMPLHFAIYAGKVEAAKVLFRARCRLNSKCHSDSLGLVTCNAGSTALHLAAMKADAESAKLILDTWAFMNAQPERRKPVQDPRAIQDLYKFTPLQIAQNLKRDGAILPLLNKLSPVSSPTNIAELGYDDLRPVAAGGCIVQISSGSASGFKNTGSKDDSTSGAYTNYNSLSTEDAGDDNHADEDTLLAGDASSTTDVTDGKSAPTTPKSHVVVPTRGRAAAHGQIHVNLQHLQRGHSGEGRKSLRSTVEPTAFVPLPLAPPPVVNKLPSRQGSGAAPSEAATAATFVAFGLGSTAAAPQQPIRMAPSPSLSRQPSRSGSRAASRAHSRSNSASNGVLAKSVLSPEEEAKAAAEADAARAEKERRQHEQETVNRAAAAAAAGLPPPNFVCPITNNVIEEPVIASDGRAYEKQAIEMWFELGNDEFPGSGLAIDGRLDLTPSPELKQKIQEWQAQAVELPASS